MRAGGSSMDYVIFPTEETELLKDFIFQDVYDRIKEENIFCICATESQLITGVLVIEVHAYDAELLCISVAPDYRRKKIATGLIQKAKQILSKTHVLHLHTTCCYPQPILTELDKFFQANQFEKETEASFAYQFPFSKLLDHPILQKELSASHKTHIFSLEHTPDFSFREFNQSLASKLHYQPFQKSDYLPDISCTYMIEQKVVGCVLVAATNDGGLALRFAYINNQSQTPTALISMLLFAIQAAKKTYSAETMVYTVCFNQISNQLFQKLMGTDIDFTEAYEYRLIVQKAEKNA